MGMVNAWEDPAFAAAVKDTGRRNLIIAGVTNDVCTVYPTLSALDEGYQVQAVADAGGSITKLADDAALRRMEKAGAIITSTTMTLTELARNWASDAGQKLLPILGELLPH
jgi:nicotinamidase-related amidase